MARAIEAIRGALDDDVDHEGMNFKWTLLTKPYLTYLQQLGEVLGAELCV